MRKFLARFKQSPVFSTVYVLGAALSVASVMLVAIFIHVKSASIYPEYSRNDLLYFRYADVEVNGHNYAFRLGYGLKAALCQALDSLGDVTVEDATNYNTIIVDNKRFDNITIRKFDHKLGNVFDLELLDGKFFSKEDCLLPDVKKVLISDRLARKIFDTDKDIVGRKIYVAATSQMGFRSNPYYEYERDKCGLEVVGVFKEGSKLLANSFAEAVIPQTEPWYWASYTDETFEAGEVQPIALSEITGSYTLAFRPAEGVTRQLVKQVADNAVNRFAQSLNVSGVMSTTTNMGKTGTSYSTISQHFDPEEGIKIDIGSWPRPSLQLELGNTSDPNEEFNPGSFTKLYGVLALILLLVPALNLSSLIAGNMDTQLSELSIRKAFGASHGRLLRQVLNENLWLTGCGSLLGVVLAWMGVAMWKSWLFAGPDGELATGDILLDPAMIFAPRVFIVAVVVCFLLNTAAAIIPAIITLRRPIVSGLKN